MSKSLRLFAVLVVGGLLAACSNTAEIGKMKVQGGKFEKALHKNYVNLAKQEHKEDDWGDAWKFEDRAKAAAMGKATAPEPVNKRKLVKKHHAPLAKAYMQLTSALNRGGAKVNPKAAANAQTNYECWMQEAEENRQPKHIAACRSLFSGSIWLLNESLGDAKPMKMAKKATKKKKAGPPRTKHFLVFFGINKSDVMGGEAKTVAAAAKFAKANKGSNVYITGHTDRSGSKEYNMKLAKKRVGAVVKGLTSMGLKKKSLGSVVQGENDPAIRTQDGKKDGRNRRVVISVIY